MIGRSGRCTHENRQQEKTRSLGSRKRGSVRIGATVLQRGRRLLLRYSGTERGGPSMVFCMLWISCCMACIRKAVLLLKKLLWRGKPLQRGRSRFTRTTRGRVANRQSDLRMHCRLATSTVGRTSRLYASTASLCIACLSPP